MAVTVALRRWANSVDAHRDFPECSSNLATCNFASTSSRPALFSPPLPHRHRSRQYYIHSMTYIALFEQCLSFHHSTATKMAAAVSLSSLLRKLVKRKLVEQRINLLHLCSRSLAWYLIQYLND